MSSSGLYLEQLRKLHSPLDKFFTVNPITEEPQQLSPDWLAENRIFLVQIASGQVIVKQTPEEIGLSDIETQRRLAEVYPNLIPAILAHSGHVCVMEFFDGQSFGKPSEADVNHNQELLGLIGQTLSELYAKSAARVSNPEILKQIAYTLKYRKDRDIDLLKESLMTWETFLSSGYMGCLIHNDLNVFNIILRSSNSIGLIDPKTDRFFLMDRAKDMGRFVASLIANMPISWYANNDVYLNAQFFLEAWHKENDAVIGRTVYYLAQSLISFSRWDSPVFSKDQFYDLAIYLLKGGPGRYVSIQSLLDHTFEGVLKVKK